MSRTQIPIVALPEEGIALSTVAADTVNGNYFQMPSSEDVLCSFFCPIGGTATVYTSYSIEGIALNNLSISLPAATVFLWRCPGSPFTRNDSSIWIDFSSATSVAIYDLGA